jgi:hypothetical protein
MKGLVGALRAAMFVVVMLPVVGLWPGVAGAPPAGRWHNGQSITFSQGDWGGIAGDVVHGLGVPSSAATLLFANYDTVYPSALVIRLSPGATFATFLSSQPVVFYMGSRGTPGPISGQHFDPP